MNRQHTKPIPRTLTLLGMLLCAYALLFIVSAFAAPLAVAQPITQPVVQNQIETAGDANTTNGQNAQTSRPEDRTNSDEPTAPFPPKKDDKQGSQGCCSYHGGICGTTPEGALLCCDGATSPTCDL